MLLLFLVTRMQTHVAEVLAAMIPCSRLYGYLGCTLAAAAAATGAGRHAYSEWLDTYSGAEYLVRTATSTPQQLCFLLTGPALANVCASGARLLILAKNDQIQPLPRVDQLLERSSSSQLFCCGCSAAGQ